MSSLEKSFFDEKNIDCSFWEKPTQQINIHKIEHQFMLFQKSKKTGFWVSRNFIIYDTKLVKLRPNKKTIHQIDLNKARIQKIKYQNDQEKESCNKKKYGFKIVRNQRCRELYSRSKELNQKIWEELKKYSLQITFKQDYQIEKMIGKGNFAKVYLCNKKSEKQQQYAVKAFEKSKMINTETDKLALLKEISILRKLNHKGLIKMHEVYEDETHIYLVQEYLQGGELYQQIKKNQKQPENIVARIIATLLESLQYLHKRNILHRDLKPENLILRKKGILDDIVIADFGLADFYDPLGNYMFQRCGTPGFVAPEILQDKCYDFKVDIFSVGCLMYLLLASKSPFKGFTYDEVVMRNYHCKIDYEYIQPFISNSCLQLLKLLLHYKPSKRPTAKETLRHEWFMQNLDKQRYEELNNNEELLQNANETNKSCLINFGNSGFMKHFVSPSTCLKPDLSNPQISYQKRIDDTVLLTPQYVILQSIQEQFKDSEQKIQIKDDFDDLILEDESPQSNKLPQYQLIGKLKKIGDSNNQSSYNSTIIKNTSEGNKKELEYKTPILINQIIENLIQPKNEAKINNKLKQLEQD
ncbi:unnamed protein product [Paramecium sonneborni]|uniref:Protein kinase domain-containing protein n=1 Tax=Paramecium sonneborni TaxID=65129 RepID=A0A8S1LRA5_9CILI|nr:unnamed protein product [Paramecium sonneborni]